MDNHPIPQDVTGFQFKLIGNMTIKQFVYLATGIVLAWIFLQLPITLLLKIPFAAFFAFMGIGLAFLPISGRPMDLMIGNFIKALFRPTQFIYEKSQAKDYLLSTLSQDNKLKPHLQPADATVPPTVSREPIQNPQPNIAASKPLSNPRPANPSPPPKPPTPVSTPDTPSSPNLIVGVTKDSRGNILPNILIEIKDNEGNPVRAFKTNEIGRFASATPLSNGTYTIEFEDPKSQNKFAAKTISATGQVILPIVAVSVDAREELRKSLFNNGNG